MVELKTCLRFSKFTLCLQVAQARNYLSRQNPWQTIFKTTQWHILVHLTTSLPSLSLRALEYLSVENWVTVFGMLGAWGRETPSPPSCSFWLWMCWMQWWTRLRRLGFLSHLTDGACGIMFLSMWTDAVIFLKPKESELIAIKESGLIWRHLWA